MQIISHRGYWKNASQKNQVIAFERSFRLNFGTETDLRDRDGEIVISHDIADKNAMTLDAFLFMYKNINPKLPLALNIKADGLQSILKQKIEQAEIENYFVFDMSVPDMIGYFNHKISFFSRQSEYELQPLFYEQCAGIWLDAFESQWYEMTLIKDHVREGKSVAIVSPELHKRNVFPLWENLKKNNIHNIEDVILCTDMPEEALTYFK